MKLTLLLLAAGLCSFSAASAQTTTPATTPSSPGTVSPNTVPSGTAPESADPKGNVTPGEVFTKGAPSDVSKSDRRMKRQKDKDMMRGDKSKMKAKSEY